jgi:hypothetical protein
MSGKQPPQLAGDAARQYRSQLHLLGLMRGRLSWKLLDEVTRSGEAIAWPPRQRFGPAEGQSA